ncbi:MAG: VIT1/CCC1 transporter family protein, partial [bacterium]
EKELALVYRSRGLDADEARKTAKAVMRDPERALAEKLQLELGGREPLVMPLPGASMAGLSALLGAAVPVLPFLRMGGEATAWLSIAFASLAGVAIGIIRSVLTGENALSSAGQTVLMASGVALAGFLVGRWILPSL